MWFVKIVSIHLNKDKEKYSLMGPTLLNEFSKDHMKLLNRGVFVISKAKESAVFLYYIDIHVLNFSQ